MSTSQDFLTHITARLDMLDQQAMEIKLAAIKMAVYIAVGPSERLRNQCIIACID